MRTRRYTVGANCAPPRGHEVHRLAQPLLVLHELERLFRVDALDMFLQPAS